MTLPYAFDDLDTADRYGMTPDQSDAGAGGYGCAGCLDDRHLAYAGGTEGSCPNCQPADDPAILEGEISS